MIKSLNKKKMFTEIQKQEIADYYLDSHTLAETGKKFNISLSSVSNILKKLNVKTRSPQEQNSLKWRNENFRNKEIEKRKGRPSRLRGMKYTHRIEKPSLRGNKNPNWKGGTTKLIQLIKGLPEYSFWRMETFKRDKWTCQECGAKNKRGEKYIFDAHHIYPISKIINDFKIETVEEAICCKELWDVENGQTLCRQCHRLTDSWGVNNK